MVRHIPFALALAFAAACTGTPPALPELELDRPPLVGGQLETGWDAVGALTINYAGYGYGGSFCSATLVAPQWVLTAAHCLSDHDGFQITPEVVEFFVGDDAQPHYGGKPLQGAFYKADLFFPHPDYNSYWNSNDIGLVHLKTPVQGVEPLAISHTAMTNGFVGEDVLYVGFGVTDGIDQTGGGLKRSGTMEIVEIQNKSYTSEYGGVGVCFGDSGGPGLLEINGTWQAVGVNSSVGSQYGDPCKGYAFHTRVDKYASWISGKLGAPLPTCQEDPGLCYCAEACLPDGTCDNTVCQYMSCQQAYGCLSSCGYDQGCAEDCFSQATPEAQLQIQLMQQCFEAQCQGLYGDAFQTCAYEQCAEEIAACFPTQAGEKTCEEAYDCIVACGQDPECQTECYYDGTAGAQAALSELFGCFQDQCAWATTTEAWQQCAWDQCAAEIYACMPPADCALTGGGCEAGEACIPLEGGWSDCVPSNGKGKGEACTPGLEGVEDCADGFFCVQGVQGALCWPLCQSFADCTEDEYCETPAWEYMEVGLCFCTDGDGDGVCRADDCDDASPSVGAGVPEVCGDGTDNDCDGESDEGCGAGEDTGAPGEDAGAPGNDLATAPDLEDDSSPVHPLVLGAGGGGSCAAGPATAPAAGLLAALALAGLRRLRQRS